MRSVVLRSATLCIFAARWAGGQTIGPFSAQTVAGWQYSIGASGNWSSNLQLDEQQPISGLSSRVGGRAARLWHSPKDRLVLSAGGAVGRLPIPGAATQNSYDLAATVDHTFSPKLSGRLETFVRSEIITRGLIGSSDGALLQGLVRIRTTSASGSFAHRLSRSLTAQYAAATQRFAAEIGSGFDGHLATTTAEVMKRLSPFASVSVGLAYQHSSIGSVIVDVPQLTVRSDQRFGRRVALQMSGGAALGGSAQTSSASQVNGGAMVSLRDDWGALSLSARRTVGQEFGRETPTLQVGDYVSLAFTRNFAKALEFTARTANGRTRGINAGSRDVRSVEAATGLGFTLRPGQTFNVGAFVYRRLDRVLVTSRGVSASIRFDRAQLRMAAQ